MKALLICNIGTPEAPDDSSVKKYLDEFLMDKDVVSLPFLLRYPLVRWIITPRRSSESAKKYRAVWTDQGSPLLVFTEDLVKNLQRHLSEGIVVRTAMRYSQPSIIKVLDELQSRGIREVFVAPMFPQFAEATTGSLIKKFNEYQSDFDFKFLEPFYHEDFFIHSFADLIAKKRQSFDHLLFSYHGLPESQVKKTAPQCLKVDNCCLLPDSCAKNCYRAQCIQTTELIARRLGLNKNEYSVSFQSRLGPVKWIRPYTDDALKELATKGVKRLAVVCPSFVTDCIETLEEIGMEGREIFHHAGGESFELIPCLNAEENWSKEFALFVKKLL